MRILITGGLGQLGTALQRVLSDHEVIVVDLPDVDISDRQAISETVRDNQ
ncbi:MAG: sugar nucleotide-binding protein, partial [Chloroflexota bacterium]